MAEATPAEARRHAADHAPAGTETLAYQNPEAVLADETLTPEQKRRFLEEWLERLQGRRSAEAAATGADTDHALAERLHRMIDDLGTPAGGGAGGSY